LPLNAHFCRCLAHFSIWLENPATCAQYIGEETSGETVAMQHAEICHTDEKVNQLKDKHEMLSSLLPDIRLLYGTQPGPRTPVMYQPGIVFSFRP
jgi:hypothetical protein